MGPHYLLHVLLPLCIPIVIFSLTIRVGWQEIVATFVQRRGILIACLLCFVVQPLVAIAICKLLGPDRVIMAIVLIAAIAPGDPFVVLEAEHRKGSIPLAITMTSLLALLMPVSLFLWLPVMFHFFGGEVPIKAGGAFVEVAKLVVPFILGGVLIRTFLPKIADFISAPLKIVSLAAYALVGVVFLFLGLKYLIDYSVMTALTVFLLTSLSLVGGYFFSGFSTERTRRTGALVVALGNYIVVCYVATEAYRMPVDRFCAALAVAIVVRVLSVIVWNALGRRSKARALAEPA